jgi:hypothetical protein
MQEGVQAPSRHECAKFNPNISNFPELNFEAKRRRTLPLVDTMIYAADSVFTFPP